MSGRLSDLLDFVKVEFETVSSQADTLRRDNHDYAAHAEMHLSEVSAIRRELTELEREHSRAKQAYEEKIADLKRQIETMRAQAGQGPPIPTVIPANTNHFGALMGHPHGMFGQGGPDRERVEAERERAAIGAGAGAGDRDVKMANGSSNGVGPAAGGPGPGHAAPAPTAGPGSSQSHQQGGRTGYAQQHHAEVRESVHERDAAYQQQLGKRTRPDESMHDGQPPAAKSRMTEGRPHENGVESRTSAAASFPPVRPPSRTYAQSPHGMPGRPISAASGTIANAPPSEPSVLSQAGPSNTSADVKPSAGSLNPPIQLQRPSSTQNGSAANPSQQATSAAGSAQDERQQHQQQTAKKQDGPSHAPASTASTQARPGKAADWDVTYNQEVPKKLDVTLAHTFLHDSVVCCVRISPDGKLLATGCNRNTTLYDTKTGAIVAQLAEEIEGKPDNYIRAVAFSPDGKRIASGSEDKIIRIWDLTSRTLLSTLRGHNSEIYSLGFSPDGTQIVSGSGDRTARIWSIEQKRVLRELRIDETRKLENGTALDAGVTSIAISPDGKLLVAGSLDHVVRIWDMQTGNLLDKLKNHKDSVYSVAFLPGGKQLLTGSLDKTLKIWDLSPLKSAIASGSKVDPEAGLTVCKQTFWGHKDFVLSVAASPDGNWIASGSKDRAVQCWDVKTGKAQFVLHGHKNSVISIAMSEVGGLLATGSGDWQARIFKITGMDDPVASSSSSGSTNTAPKPAATSSAAQSKPLPSIQGVHIKPAPTPASSNSSATLSAPAEPKKDNVASQSDAQQKSKDDSAGAPPTRTEAGAARPATPAGNEPSSPGAMKVDPPAEKSEAEPAATTTTERRDSTTSQNGAKEVQEKKDEENDKPASADKDEAKAAPK